jgi:CRP/FNR family transcriptional regulator, anaerobic regulatory protein
MEKALCQCERCSHRLCARRVPIFFALSEDELGRVVNLIVRREYLKGELIILEGANLENLVIINMEQVKAFKNSQEGKEQILYIFS